MSTPKKTLIVQPEGPEGRRVFSKRCVLVGATCLGVLAAAAGCDSSGRTPRDGSATGNQEGPAERPSVTLRVGVVSDEPLRRAIDQLRGEWSQRSGDALETSKIDSASAEALREASVDLVCFPSRALGELCEEGALRPVRAGVLAAEGLAWQDIAPLVREREASYGGVVMALPLGSATPLLLGPADALRIRLAGDDEQIALSFLAWAAPYALHPGTVATLFDAETLAPRVASPGFARALETLADAVGTGAAAAEDQESRLVVLPRRDPQRPGGPPGEVSPLGDAAGVRVFPMPGSPECYNPIAGQWEPAVGRATLVCGSGTLLAVTAVSRNAAGAFRLAQWLAGGENARSLSTASSGVAVCRDSLAGAADTWIGGDREALGAEFSRQNVSALHAGRSLVAPRLPAAGRYLRTLGEAVRLRLDGKRTGAEALAAATAAWEAITDERGRAAQRLAYLRSVGLAPYEPPVR